MHISIAVALAFATVVTPSLSAGVISENFATFYPGGSPSVITAC